MYTTFDTTLDTTWGVPTSVVPETRGLQTSNHSCCPKFRLPSRNANTYQSPPLPSSYHPPRTTTLLSWFRNGSPTTRPPVLWAQGEVLRDGVTGGVRVKSQIQFIKPWDQRRTDGARSS